MKTTPQAKTPPMLLYGRHIVGMALFALLNPLIYYDSQPIIAWLTGWAVALVVAAILFGAYALFFTERAKSAWPGGVFMLAWVLVVLVVIGNWSTYNEIRSGAAARRADREQVASTAPRSGIDAPLDDSPSFEEAKLWTQENTGSSANAQWLKTAPAGSRFCRMHDGAIVILFPPGVRPQAEQANPFCANGSVDSPDKLGFTNEKAGKDEWWKKGSTPVNPSQQNYPGLKPFTGKLDGE